MNSLQNYCFARITSKISIKKYYKKNKEIVLSAQHKDDSQAMILIEHTDINEEDTLNEYLFEFYFKDYSKSLIKSFQIQVDQMACIQESNVKGLVLGNIAEHNPVPVGFSIALMDAITYPIWIGNDTFKIQLKIYAKGKGTLDRIIDNEVTFCLMFDTLLTSVSGITTELRYKIWIEKDKQNENGYTATKNETQLVKIN